jgi:hypothetical protein
MALKDARLSPSIAQILNEESPLHAWTIHRKLGNRPRPSTAPMEQGKIIHALLLEEGDKIAIVEADSFRTKVAKEERDSARSMGLIPVLSTKIADYQGVVDKIKASLFDGGVNLVDYDSEVLMEWEEPASDGTDVKCKGYLDLISKDDTKIIDIKTLPSGRAHPELCAGRLLKTAGVIQAKAYPSAVEALHFELAGRVSMSFFFCELTDPFDVVEITMGGTMQEIAELRWSRAIDTWARCVEKNEWPGFGDKGPVRVEAPGWAMSRELEKDLE